MKTLSLFVIVLVAVVSLRSEGPTISRSTVPSIGTTINHRHVTMGGLFAGAAGANQTWDYSSLTDSAAVYTEQYISPGGTPYATLFPSANVAVLSNDNPVSYSYFVLDDSKMEALGVVSGSDTDMMSNTKMVTAFPRAYLSVAVDDYVGQMTGSSEIIYSARDSSVYDAYGTLKLPHALIYDNVARMTSYITYTMAEMSDTTQKYTIHLKRYTYFSPSFGGGAVLSMQSMILAGILTRWTSADYVTGLANDVSDNAVPASLRLSPNPTQEVLIIRTDSPDNVLGIVEVYDQLGQCVMHVDAGRAAVYQVPVTSLPTGNYVFRIMMNDKAYTQKVCVVH